MSNTLQIAVQLYEPQGRDPVGSCLIGINRSIPDVMHLGMGCWPEIAPVRPGGFTPETIDMGIRDDGDTYVFTFLSTPGYPVLKTAPLSKEKLATWAFEGGARR